MKKNLAIIFTIFSALLILDSINFSQALMMFLLAGVIPGTSIVIDGAQMLEFCALVFGFIVARVMMYSARNLKFRSFKNTRVHA